MRKYFRAVRKQTEHLLLSKGAMATFALLLALVFLSFAENVNEFRGYDIVSMYHPMKILLLSYNRTYYSLVNEQHNGEAVLAVSRLGPRTYIWSKLTAAFITNFVVFSVPFLIEIVLNCLSFPSDAIGDFSGANTYSKEFQNVVDSYFLSGLYKISPYLYAVMCTLGLGVFAGLLATVTISISAVIKVKYSVTLILPAFLLLEATVYLKLGTGWYNYIMFFNEKHGAAYGALIFMLLAAGFTVFSAECFSRKDSL